MGAAFREFVPPAFPRGYQAEGETVTAWVDPLGHFDPPRRGVTALPVSIRRPDEAAREHRAAIVQAAPIAAYVVRRE